MPRRFLRTRTLETDVLVCGGGCAGLGGGAFRGAQRRAHAADRARGFCRRIITAVGLPYFDGIADIKDNRVVVRGIGLELLAKSGVCAPDATHVKVHNPTIPNVESFKLLADRLLLAEGERLRVLYHSMVCGVEMDGERIAAVLVANKAGLVRCGPSRSSIARATPTSRLGLVRRRKKAPEFAAAHAALPASAM